MWLSIVAAFFFTEIFIELIVDSYPVRRNNVEQSLADFIQMQLLFVLLIYMEGGKGSRQVW